ncbi:MAG TPA: hypothetical protein PKZ35_17485 [Gammaproteobacteria bacterium]|nr:hypothetical protein [Gammaproteobacteria bacterium]
MFRLRRLIAVVLMLSVFGYGTAWAFHWHSPASDAVHAQQVDTPDHNDAGGGCDHCCHASAHFVSLIHQVQPFVSVPDVRRASLPARVYVRRSTAPPLKPPQA